MKKMNIKNLTKILKHKNPFPYSDIRKMLQDYQMQFDAISEFAFSADFNQFCAQIAGTLSYFDSGTEESIPEKQLDKMQYSFFEMFPQYEFVYSVIEKYPNLYKEYLNYETARKIILDEIIRRKLV